MDPGGDSTRPHHDVHTLPHVGAPATGDTTLRTPEGHVIPLPAEAQVGGYRLERVLGRGGMGVVYLAESIALRRKVALKLLTAYGDVELVERFLIEARAAARIDHPNVVRVHEVGRDGARWFLAMDLVDGESLRARAQRDGPLEQREAARVLEAIGRALHHAHALGVLHRDVKPHNVLLSSDGTPRLADFGLAKLQGDPTSEGITASGAVLGTPAYMPPEQAQGDPALVDRRSDVYSLGATLYEALSGRAPFEGPTAMNILHQVFTAAPLPPSRLRAGLDRDLETICLRALEKDPGARYDTAGALADDLARWSRGEPIVARRVSLAERLTKWARRRPLAASALLVAAAASIATIAAITAAQAERRRLAESARSEALTAVEDVGAVDSGAPAGARADRLARASHALDVVRRWAVAWGGPDATDLLVRVARDTGDQARELEQYSVAREAYAAAAKVRPDVEELGSHRAAVALEKAHLLRRASELRAARHQLEDARELRPDWPQVWFELAEVAFGEGASDEVDVCLTKARALAPDDPALLLKQAGHQFMLDRHQDSLRTAQRVVELRPELLWGWLQCADARAALDDGPGALADCDRFLSLTRDPRERALGLRRRARVQGRVKNLRGAISDLEEVTSIQPEAATAWTELGKLLRLAGRFAEADAALTEALRLAPEDEEALVEQVHVRIKIGGPLEGAVLDAALRARPDDPMLLTRRAGSWIGERDFMAAHEDADRALFALPRDSVAAALMVRAAALRALHQLDRAEADATAVLSLFPRLPDPWLARGMIRQDRGEVEGAIEDLERFLELAPKSWPGSPAVHQTLEQLRARRPR